MTKLSQWISTLEGANHALKDVGGVTEGGFFTVGLGEHLVAEVGLESVAVYDARTDETQRFDDPDALRRWLRCYPVTSPRKNPANLSIRGVPWSG